MATKTKKATGTVAKKAAGKAVKRAAPKAAAKADVPKVAEKKVTEEEAAHRLEDGSIDERPRGYAAVIASGNGSRGPGGLDAAVRVLQEEKVAIACKPLTRLMFERGYWTSDGLSPQSTMYAAIIREIKKKGELSRFKRGAVKGTFELTKTGLDYEVPTAG